MEEEEADEAELDVDEEEGPLVEEDALDGGGSLDVAGRLDALVGPEGTRSGCEKLEEEEEDADKGGGEEGEEIGGSWDEDED